jgi:hypothetical protein
VGFRVASRGRTRAVLLSRGIGLRRAAEGGERSGHNSPCVRCTGAVQG